MGNPLEFYFKVLDIPKDSSPQEIRSAYKALVKKWHPDKHPPSSRPEAESMFKAISQAYEALNDQEDNRSMFEAYTEGGGVNSGYGQSFVPKCRSQEFPPRGGAKSGLGREFRDENRVYEFAPRSAKSFGREFKDDKRHSSDSAAKPGRPALSSRSGPITQQPKPPPVERKLECTLEELCRGCKKEIRFMRDVVMKNGVILKKEESHMIKVKPGWKNGTKITFEGMGDERPGGCPAPDVIYVISEKEHPVYKRVGNDLVLKVEVPLVNALTGWTFSFRLLTGEKATCSFQDEVIYPGYEKVVKGQGMPLPPHHKAAGARGDLRILFNIVFPAESLTDEQRTAISDLLKDCN